MLEGEFNIFVLVVVALKGSLKRFDGRVVVLRAELVYSEASSS
jgi:hypothetical protein